MSTTTSAQTRHGAGSVSRAAVRWRTTVLAWLGAVVVCALLTGTRPGTLGALQAGLASGEVTEVHLIGALPPGASGQAHVEVLWHDGLLPRYTEVQQGRLDAGSQFSGFSEPPLVGADLAGELTASTPDGHLRVTGEDIRRGWQGLLLDWYVATWVSLAATGWVIATFLTMVFGPQPRLATRWAWFWLFWSSGGLAMVPYAILGLPRAGQPIEPEGRCITGGWAFLLAVLVIGPMLSS